MSYPPQQPPGPQWQPNLGAPPNPVGPSPGGPPRHTSTVVLVLLIVGALVLVGGIVLAVVLTSGGGHGGGLAVQIPTTAAPSAVQTNGVSAGPCKYTATPQTPAPSGKEVGLPDDPYPTPSTGTVTVTLHTNLGDIPLALDRAEAPCTVQSFLHLASSKFFDSTSCHRETAYPTLKVLQCGDPTGEGTGGPGYVIPDEKPTGLRPAQTNAGDPPASVYPRGTIAMANTGQPNTGGSQFFLVYGDSQLPPDYTIFGAVSPAGLTTMDTITANGITPGTDPSTGQTSDQDGKPRQTVTIEQAQVG